MNNEIRRIKTKLKLFEEEGFNWAVTDIIKDMMVTEITGREIQLYIEGLKKRYLTQLKALSPKDNKQGKLDI